MHFLLRRPGFKPGVTEKKTFMLKNPHNYQHLNYHVIFSTKYRQKIINYEMLDQIRLHTKDKSISLGFIIHILNGYQDHIHILLSIPPKYSLYHIVKEIKGYTSYKIPELKWQRGYGVFTVDKNSFSGIFEYIKNQEIHHK
jgi:putative transposase